MRKPVLWAAVAPGVALAAAATALFGIASGTAAAHPACPEYVNPHGATIPPAGQTSPGTNPRSGQNPDGFYLLTFDIPAALTPYYAIRVTDLGSGTNFGPYPRETTIKYTQAPGATPSEKKIGSTNGQAGAVYTHITGVGDFQLTAVWAVGNPFGGTPGGWIGSGSGNPIPQVTCYVPPPPK